METKEHTLVLVNLSEFWDSIDGQRQDLTYEFIGHIKRIFRSQDSIFILIIGRRGTGKTDLALLISEIAYGQNIIKHVSTNTKILRSNFPIDKIDNLQDLDYWGQKKKGRKIFIFDEIADAMSRRRPMAALTVELIKKFNKLRKHKLSIIATTISKDVLDKAAMARDLLDATYRKEWKPLGNKQIYKIAYYDNFLNGESITFGDLPPTSVHFDSWDGSEFSEKPKESKIEFKDKDMELVYRWAKGETYTELGVHPQQLTRAKKKIIPILIDNYLHASHNKGSG